MASIQDNKTCMDWRSELRRDDRVLRPRGRSSLEELVCRSNPRSRFPDAVHGLLDEPQVLKTCTIVNGLQ
jgi:hypothetical protein